MQKWMILSFICLLSFVYATTEEVEDGIHIIQFSNDSVIRSESVQVVDNALQIGATRYGEIISNVIYATSDFNAMTVSWQCDIPEGADVQISVRATSKEGVVSLWKTAAQNGGDIRFEEISIAFQSRICLIPNEAGESPRLYKVVLSYSLIPEAMFSMDTTPVAYTTRGVTKPAIVSRADWGARAPNGSYSSHSPQKITIHHTWRPTAAQYAGASSIRSIQNYHMDSNGWMDIGYHFLIGTYPGSGDTKIYQGRPETVIGAHTGGANTNNVGVNVIGDYTTETLHNNSYQALIKLLGWLCVHYGISTNNIYGHCDFNSTACPGTNIYSKMAKIRQDVKDYIDGGSTSTGILTGAIYDAAQGTSSRLAGAVVKLNSGHNMTTPTNGIYSFTLPVGTYQITVTKSGYQNATSSDTVVAGQTIWESIGLKK